MAMLRLQRACRRFSTSAQLTLPGTTIVRDRDHAQQVLEALMQSPEVVHACDTEVADIDVASQSPVGNGKVICASIYSGPHVSGDREPRIWIDNMDEAEVRFNFRVAARRRALTRAVPEHPRPCESAGHAGGIQAFL